MDAPTLSLPHSLGNIIELLDIGDEYLGASLNSVRIVVTHTVRFARPLRLSGSTPRPVL
jgi:hypothetical protein